MICQPDTKYCVSELEQILCERQSDLQSLPAYAWCGAPVADAMDKPLTDQELAQQYEQQLAAGVEERRALRARLRTVWFGHGQGAHCSRLLDSNLEFTRA